MGILSQVNRAAVLSNDEFTVAAFFKQFTDIIVNSDSRTRFWQIPIAWNEFQSAIGANNIAVLFEQLVAPALGTLNQFHTNPSSAEIPSLQTKRLRFGRAKLSLINQTGIQGTFQFLELGQQVIA